MSTRPNSIWPYPRPVRRFLAAVPASELRPGLLVFEARKKAVALLPGHERDQLLKNAERAETASEREGWTGPESLAISVTDVDQSKFPR